MSTKMASEQQAADGRVIGARARATRRRLLDETARFLDSNGVLELKVVDITRAIGTSPATFYQYFNDVDDAILMLAEEAGEDERALVEYFSSDWHAENGLESALDFVDAYRRYWNANRGVLRIRNLKAEEGDRRFRAVRRRASVPMVEAMAAMVRNGIEAGRLSRSLDPFATGAAMLAMLERLLSYQVGLGRAGSSVSDLRSTLATVLHQTLAAPHLPSAGLPDRA